MSFMILSCSVFLTSWISSFLCCCCLVFHWDTTGAFVSPVRFVSLRNRHKSQFVFVLSSYMYVFVNVFELRHNRLMRGQTNTYPPSPPPFLSSTTWNKWKYSTSCRKNKDLDSKLLLSVMAWKDPKYCTNVIRCLHNTQYSVIPGKTQIFPGACKLNLGSGRTFWKMSCWKRIGKKRPIRAVLGGNTIRAVLGGNTDSNLRLGTTQCK